MSLFRKEVLTSNKDSSVTSAIFVIPLSIRLISLFAGCLVFLLILCLFCFQYTKRVQVNGLLVPERGVVRVVAPQVGTVVERKVTEGQKVVAGEILYVLSHQLSMAKNEGERQVGNEDAIIATLEARRQSVRTERKAASEILAREQRQITLRVLSVRAEADQLKLEIDSQAERVELAKIQQSRTDLIRAKGFISDAAYQSSLSDKLEQEARLSDLKRQRISLLREADQLAAELGVQSQKALRDNAQLERSALGLDQEGLLARARRQFYVVAPIDGVVTAILAEPGQTTTGQALLSILPTNAVLEAHLYVPSAAVGFIEKDQQVAIRYAAFPAIKYGQQNGKVIDISRTALGIQDIPSQLSGQSSSSSLGLYRVRVAISFSKIHAGGRDVKLSSGMQLDADILQEKKSLWNWMFDPLHSSIKRL